MRLVLFSINLFSTHFSSVQLCRFIRFYVEHVVQSNEVGVWPKIKQHLPINTKVLAPQSHSGSTRSKTTAVNSATCNKHVLKQWLIAISWRIKHLRVMINSCEATVLTVAYSSYTVMQVGPVGSSVFSLAARLLFKSIFYSVYSDFILTLKSLTIYSGVFRGRVTVRCPPLWPDHENFLRRLYMKKCVFAVFQQELQNSTTFDGLFHTDTICDWNRHVRLHLIWRCDFLRFRISEKNGGICGFHWTFKSKKRFSFRGASPPDPPTRGSAPGLHSAHSPCPPFAKS